MDNQYLTLTEISLKFNIPYILCSNYINKFEVNKYEDKYDTHSESFNFFILAASQKKPIQINDLKSGLISYIIDFLEENNDLFSNIDFFASNNSDILFNLGYKKSKELFKLLKLNTIIKTLKVSEKLKLEKFNSSHFPSKVDSEFLYFVFPYIEKNRITQLLKTIDNEDINNLMNDIKDNILNRIDEIEYELDIYYVKKKAI